MAPPERVSPEMIASIVSAVARREFNAGLRFNLEATPQLPTAPETQSSERLLYLHIPFCEQLCPYCSFHRVIWEQALCREYFAALRREIMLYRHAGWSFSGVYVGGGTPTVMMGELQETLELVRNEFPLRSISVETNPHHLTDENIRRLQDSGVDRLSVGVQSFDDELLKRMGRYQKYGSGEEIARRLGAVNGHFATVNADMIFNFPTQSREALLADVATILGIGVSQVTYYPLMVADYAREAMFKALGGRVSYSREREFYTLLSKMLETRYYYSSAWCFSLSRAIAIDEYIVDFPEYAGLGSGAIGFLRGVCYANTFDIKGYIARVNAGMLPVMAARVFTLADRARYDFMMRLFSTKLESEGMEEAWRHIWKELLAFRLAGALEMSEKAVTLTPRGRYLWVALMREFFIAVNNFRDHCRGVR